MKDDKIIFLDMDGPCIPTSLVFFLETNPGDRIMSNVVIGMINNICKRTGAKLVTNTTHNIDHQGQLTIREALIQNGVKEEFFHENHKTDYGVTNSNRMKSINKWLIENGEPKNWVAVDDENFTDVDNLVLIDRDNGITLKDMHKIMEKFGVKRNFLEI